MTNTESLQVAYDRVAETVQRLIAAGVNKAYRTKSGRVVAWRNTTYQSNPGHGVLEAAPSLPDHDARVLSDAKLLGVDLRSLPIAFAPAQRWSADIDDDDDV